MIPSPQELGAPPRFTTWRHAQSTVFERLLLSGKRVDVATIPTGGGKSLLAWGYAKLLAGRAVFLTDSRGLMDQYRQDFESVGLHDVRGMANYPCRLLDTGWGKVPRCDEGPCLDGETCMWKGGGCGYFDAWREGREASMVVTNYAAWFAHPVSENPQAIHLGPRDLLICDEAHTLEDQVMRAAGGSISFKELEEFGDGGFERVSEEWELPQWQEWAKTGCKMAEHLAAAGGDKRKLRSLWTRFTRVTKADSTWAWDVITGRGAKITFEPTTAAPHAEALLFRGISKILLLSATIREPMVQALGLTQDHYNMFETPSPFPPETRPIYWAKTGMRVTGKTSETNLLYWVGQMDQVIAGRTHLKGLIHAVSYARAKFIQQHSRFGHLMILHDSDNTRETIRRFKAGTTGILVSPAVHTGWDFPLDEARWQIIAKVPFPDCRRGIAKARKALDEQYDVKQAIATIVQMAGRIVRTEGDCGETIIVDDSIEWVWKRYRPWFPGWFRSAFKEVGEVPKALYDTSRVLT